MQSLEASTLIIQYNNELIPIVDSYVYLGVEFNNNLDLKLKKWEKFFMKKKTLF